MRRSINIGLALLAILVTAAWSNPAVAADCRDQTDMCDQGQAYAAIHRLVDNYFNQSITYNKGKSFPTPERPVPGQWNSMSGSACATHTCFNATVDFRVWYKDVCSSRPEQTGWKGGGAAGIGSVCSDGCAYDGSLDASSPTGRSFAPTGQTCSNSDAPPPETAGPGDGEGGGGGGGETGGGENGGGGGEGGGENGGGGGGGAGPGEGEGEGEGGEGGGTGPGTGPGEGEGEGEGPGQTTPPDGKLYKKSEKTMEKVADDFIDRAKKTNLVKGITDFMKVPGGGSCPVFTVSASKWWASMTYSAHCSGDFLALLRLCGYVIFAIAAYAAVRIALT